MEWRVDWFEGVFDFDQVKDVAQALRDVLQDTPILFTFRTAKEGGEKAIEPEAYVELNQNIAKTGLVDLVDVEAFTGDDYVAQIIEVAHQNNVKVVASNHDLIRHQIKQILFRVYARCRNKAPISQRSR